MLCYEYVVCWLSCPILHPIFVSSQLYYSMIFFIAVKARRGNRKKTRTSSRNNNVRSREPGLVSQQYQPGTQIPVEVVLSESFVDIMWQVSLTAVDYLSKCTVS